MRDYPYIIFYDSVCGLCNRSVQFVIKRDKKSVFRFSALDSEFAKEKLKNTSLGNTMDEGVVLYSANQIFTHSDAVMEILKLLGFPYNLLLVFYIFPNPLRNKVYNWIARNRYKIWGKHSSCPIPFENQKKLFLD